MLGPAGPPNDDFAFYPERILNSFIKKTNNTNSVTFCYHDVCSIVYNKKEI